MIKNFYMSPFYWFGWRNLAKDMEAQNFFLADDKKSNVENTIKVYPSLETKSDLERTFRDVQPDTWNITVMKTGFLSSFQFWGTQYFRLWEVLYEGDKLTLFGVLTYDTNTKQASFDKTVAIMATKAKDSIKSMLNWDFWSANMEQVMQGLSAGVLIYLAYTCAKSIANHLRR